MTWPTQMTAGLDPEDVTAYGELLSTLRGFQDALASAAPGRSEVDELTNDLNAWRERLAESEACESGPVFGHIPSLPNHGHAMVPPFTRTLRRDDRVEGTVTFGQFFIGGGGAVHGGAIALLFDEIVGALATTSLAGRTRTAYLHVDYRNLTPIDTELTVTSWVVCEEGRKRYLRGELRHGETLCAEAEGLFVVLRPDQG